MLVQFILLGIVPHHTHVNDLPPMPVWSLLSTIMGVILGVVILMIGYVNVDSKRRGMNSLLWTLLVIFVPKALGLHRLLPAAQAADDALPQVRYVSGSGLSFLPEMRLRGYAHVPPLRPLASSAISRAALIAGRM